MGKATSATLAKRNAIKVDEEAILFAQTFTIDKATVTSAFTSTMLADFKAIGETVNKYAGKAEFIELRVACFELAIKKSLVKAGMKCDDALAHELAIYDKAKNPEARELSAAEQAARKSARNTWFGFTQKCGIVTQEVRGGANNTDGVNGATSGKPKGGAAPRKEDKPALTEQTSQAATDAADIVVKHLPLTELANQYDCLKHYLIKLQKVNAKVYAGDEGAKLLSKHLRIIAILNEK